MIWKFDKSSAVLFGSFHVLNGRVDAYSNEIEKIYLQSSRIVLEADINKVDFLGLFYKNGQKLSDNLPRELFFKTKDRWLELGFSLEELEVTKSWQVANKMNTKLLADRGFVFSNGIDKQLLERARKDGKEIAFLEPPNASLDCFDNIPECEQLEYLSIAVNKPDEVIGRFNLLLAAWLAGDVMQLSSVLDECLEKFPVLYTTLVIDRNKAWEKKIFEIITSGISTLIVVGALHCVGEKYSIQSIMGNMRGYSSNGLI